MAEGGKRGDGRGLEETKERSRSFDDHSDLFLMGAKRNLSRGILIHLTGTEGEWDSLDDDELIFSLDHGEDDVCKSPSKETPRPAEDQSSLKSFHVPLSPSSPESLGNCSPAGPSFLSPGPSSPSPRPLASLVKSLSTELEPKEGTTFGPRPLLSLVKSISTELSRSEPEVSQSKSDSRLNLHLWRQLTQTRARSSEDSRTAPPSPSGDGLKGGFFKAELEDTRRKFSEAVHEPLSCVFGKIMGEESPKHQSGSGRRGPGRDGSIDAAPSESPVRTARRADGEALPVFEWPSVRRLARGQPGLCPIHHQGQRPREQELEICADANTMQMIAVRTLRGPSGSEAPQSSEPPRPPPRTSLFCIAVLSYAYFILPLGPYVSGLALGLALGFLLALFLIRVGSCGSGRSAPDHSTALTQLGKSGFTDGFTSTEPETLKGWMNEIHEYDPETCHPALTHSVFATLEGSRLHLDVPRTNISRRAAHDKRLQEATFVKSRCFHLAKSKVFLLPSVLARKRVWNPKYPICIQLDGGGPSPDEDEEAASAESPTSEPVADRMATASPTSTNQTGDAPARLYLFGRTGREKEEWFRRFQLASVDKEVEKERDVPRPRTGLSRSADPAENVHVPRSRGPSSEDKAPPSPPATRRLPVLDYHRYMARLLAADEMTPLSSPGAGSAEASPTFKANCSCQHINSSTTAWANALIGRIFWDLLREKPWADAISRKIQRKLGKIRLPYFMSGLTLTELDMGCSVPQITATSRPEVNHRGLWVELQLVYTGNLQMTLQTNFNLSKLGKEGSQETAHSFTDAGSTRPVLSVLADSDEESSSAASSDEEELLLSEPHCPAAAAAPEGTGGGKTGRKILRFVDKIAKSKCFQRAAENEFIKKKFEEMSNTPLLLSVEVRELSGTLVVNIPAPPTDRIWYSFCEPPKLDLHVCPKLGEREVTFCHVTEWIEKKLQDEFQKVFVLPNMDDIYVALMESGMDDPS